MASKSAQQEEKGIVLNALGRLYTAEGRKRNQEKDKTKKSELVQEMKMINQDIDAISKENPRPHLALDIYRKYKDRFERVRDPTGYLALLAIAVVIAVNFFFELPDTLVLAVTIAVILAVGIYAFLIKRHVTQLKLKPI